MAAQVGGKPERERGDDSPEHDSANQEAESRSENSDKLQGLHFSALRRGGNYRAYDRKHEQPEHVIDDGREGALPCVDAVPLDEVELFAVLGASGWGWLLLVLGLAMAISGILVAGRRIPRTRYRPDPWGWPETLTAATGITAAVAVIASSTSAITLPLTWPTLPPLAVAAILACALPAALTPPPPLPWRTA